MNPITTSLLIHGLTVVIITIIICVVVDRLQGLSKAPQWKSESDTVAALA
jgi:hypothetical protein